MTTSPPFRFLMFAIAMHLSLLQAQIRVYDRQRDAIAQQALEHANAIESGTIFEKQSRNARALAAQEVAVMLNSEGGYQGNYIVKPSLVEEAIASGHNSLQTS